MLYFQTKMNVLHPIDFSTTFCSNMQQNLAKDDKFLDSNLQKCF